MKLALRCRSDAEEGGDGEPPDEGGNIFFTDDGRRVGFFIVAAQLGKIFVEGNPDRYCKMKFFSDDPAQFVCYRGRVLPQ